MEKPDAGQLRAAFSMGATVRDGHGDIQGGTDRERGVKNDFPDE